MCESFGSMLFTVMPFVNKIIDNFYIIFNRIIHGIRSTWIRCRGTYPSAPQDIRKVLTKTKGRMLFLRCFVNESPKVRLVQKTAGAVNFVYPPFGSTLPTLTSVKFSRNSKHQRQSINRILLEMLLLIFFFNQKTIKSRFRKGWLKSNLRSMYIFCPLSIGTLTMYIASISSNIHA